MQNAKREDTSATNLAGAGHDFQTAEPPGRVEGGDTVVANKKDLARSEHNRLSAKEGQPDLDFPEEYLSQRLDPNARAVLRSLTYSGPLPIASEMNSYDDETRQHILEMDRMQVEHSINIQEIVTHEVVESDRMQSRREDDLVRADIEQSQKAQNKTFIIDMALIVALIVAIIVKQQVAVGAIATLLGSVSITAMFTSHRSRDYGRRRNAEKQDEDGSE